MRIATWNLNRCRAAGSDRAKRLLGQIETVEADVWVLTETYQDFTPGTEYELIAHSTEAPDRNAKRGECWVAVWSRRPLSAQKVKLTKDLERVAAARVGKTTIVGTVLPWLSDSRDPKLRGKAAFLARLDDQAADWKRLRNEPGAMCVAGDFNQDLLLSGHYYGSDEGRTKLRATLCNTHLKCLTAGNDDPLKGTQGHASIDHICIGDLRAVNSSHRLPASGPLKGFTDHFGIWVDVETI